MAYATQCNFATLDLSTGIVVSRRADRNFEQEGPVLCDYLTGLVMPSFPDYSVTLKYATEHRCGLRVRGPGMYVYVCTCLCVCVCVCYGVWGLGICVCAYMCACILYPNLYGYVRVCVCGTRNFVPYMRESSMSVCVIMCLCTFALIAS